MSKYPHSSGKKIWKWTPAKIAAFSMFGVMIMALVYFESSSSKSTFQTVPKKNMPNPVSASTDFDREYQKFLANGRKVVAQETLDSLSAIQNIDSPQAVEFSDLPKEAKSENSKQNVPGSTVNENPAPKKIPGNVENKIKVGLIPPANTKNRDEQEITGILQEANPNEYQPAGLDLNISRNSEPDQAITEQFYTEDTISGRVAALANGAPLNGVKVSVKGTTNLAVSDENGRYAIKVPGDPSHRTILYSFQGRSTERDVEPGTNVMNIFF
jgi:hypothetical protein